MREIDLNELSKLIRETVDNLGAFCRDTALAPNILARYQPGLMFREPTFCDASYKVAGFAAPHRYLIFSANARCLDEYSEHPEWGLCIWMTGSCFKVIGRLDRESHTQVTLLEIPEPLVPLFATEAVTSLEQQLAAEACALFEEALVQPALPELSTRIWLDRLTLPVGIDEQGNFFELLAGPTNGANT